MKSCWRRALLESLKFLSLSEVLSVSLTSSFFLSAAHDHEIWFAFLGRDDDEHRLASEPQPSTYDYCRCLHSQRVAVVREEHLLCYSPGSRTWARVPVLGAPDTTAIVYIGKNLFFCCADKTFLVSARTGCKRMLEGMEVQKLYPGLCYADRFVYCFGGDAGGPSRRCERFNLNYSVWERLPQAIEPRSAFTPVLHNMEIYLAGGFAHSVEVFSPAAMAFRLLGVTLPFQEETACLEYKGRLAVIGDSGCCFLDFPSEQVEFRAFSIKKKSMWSACRPVEVRGKVLLTRLACRKWCFDFLSLETLKMVSAKVI